MDAAPQPRPETFHLGVDCYPLTLPERGSGVRRYFEEVLRRARAPFWPAEIHCFTKGNHPASDVTRLNEKLRHRPTQGGSFIWRHVALPRAAAKDGVQMMWFPFHIVPFHFSLPNVVTIHDISFSVLPESRRTRAGMYLNAMLHRAIAQAHHIITVSEFTATELMRVHKVPGNKITPILHGATEPEAGLSAERWATIASAMGIVSPYFLFLGGPDPRKNFPFLVECIRRNPALLEANQFVITGSREGAIQTLRAAGLGRWIGERILLPGLVSDEELNGLYRGARALLYLSLYEGFGMPIVEAFARDCPVLALRASCLPEIAGDAAVYVAPGDCAGLQAGLTAIASGSARADLIALGRERIKKFDWQTCADQTGAAIAAAVKVGPGSLRAQSGR